jgi:glycosyltransferase involved in cell wall biosynthesis
VRALAPLAGLDWRLTIAGATDRDPAAAADLRAVIAETGLSERVTLAGTVVPATLERFYASADVFVSPSEFEGYGMVLAEAMARGLPIVASSGGAADETVPDAAALKVAPGDVDALTRALRSAISERRLRGRLADASWEAGRALPTWNETARRIAAAVLGVRP